MNTDRLLVGRIVKAHGIKGEVALEVFSDVPGRFAPGARLHAGERDLTVATSREHQGRMLVRFEGVADRTTAEDLRNLELSVDASASPELEEGSYYTHQLIGCAVRDRAGNALGEIARIEEGKANDVWVVSDGAREVLVPAVRAIVAEIDIAGRTVTLDPPDGLF